MQSWSWKVKICLCLLMLTFGIFEGSVVSIILSSGWYILALSEFNEEYDNERKQIKSTRKGFG